VQVVRSRAFLIGVTGEPGHYIASCMYLYVGERSPRRSLNKGEVLSGLGRVRLTREVLTYKL